VHLFVDIRVSLDITVCAGQPPPTTPASVAYELRNYRFACQNGKVKEISEEFEAFKKHYYHSSWGRCVFHQYLNSVNRVCISSISKHQYLNSVNRPWLLSTLFMGKVYISSISKQCELALTIVSWLWSVIGLVLLLHIFFFKILQLTKKYLQRLTTFN